MSFYNKPKDDGNILLLISLFILFLFFISSCGSLTSEYSCDNKLDIKDRRKCLAMVNAKQRQLNKTREFHNRRR